MAKQSELAKVLASIDAQIAQLQQARKLITDAQAERQTAKATPRRTPRKKTSESVAESNVRGIAGIAV